MPVRIDVIIITPIASIVNVQATLGISPSSPVFTEADDTPRDVTHRSWNGQPSVSQRAIIQDHLDNGNNNPALADSFFAWWPRNLSSPYADLLATNGLTLNDGSMGE